MSKDILEYRGYYTKIHFDSEDKLLYGKIEGIADSISFHSEDGVNIEKEFHLAVDDYLEFCSSVGKTPDKPFKGSFNVRVEPRIHRELFFKAERNGTTLNAIVSTALSDYITNDIPPQAVVFNFAGEKRIAGWYTPELFDNDINTNIRVLLGGQKQ